jgi:YD repeat-containing protein
MRREGLIAYVAIVVAVCSMGKAFADVTPEDEYRKKIRVSEEISPLGEHPFGEHISTYNGSLSFLLADVTVAGTGPTISLVRSFHIPDLTPAYEYQQFITNAMVDWELETPRIETYAAPLTSTTWTFLDATQRCSSFSVMPDITINGPHQTYVTYESGDWWHGYQLHIDGNSQDLLFRDASNTNSPQSVPTGMPTSYPIVTKNNWVVGCTAQTANGAPGQGFVALSPDGTRYWLDWLAYKNAPTMNRDGGGALHRRIAMMLASKIEDRFGNSISFTYDSMGNPTSVTGTDGRAVSLAYDTWQRPEKDSFGQYINPPSPRLRSITVHGAAGETRQWSYGYGNDPSIPRLTSVIQPDGKMWTFNMGGLQSPVTGAQEEYPGCEYSGPITPSPISTATITHPSGLVGTFNVRTRTRGFSYVTKICDASSGQMEIKLPHAYRQAAIDSEVLSGAGMTTPRTWSYAYSTPNQSWAEDCTAGCANRIWTEVTAPDLHTTRYIFSNVYDASNSLLYQIDAFTGASGSAVARSEAMTYSSPSAGPWPARYGSTQAQRVNKEQMERVMPMASKVISVSGDTYTWQANAFNAFVQPTSTTRSSSANSGQSLVEQTSYLNDLPHWVLGLSTTVISDGETVSQIDYDLASVTPLRRYRFGQLLMTYGFNAAGQLASYTDPLSHITTLSNYKRGIPRSIGFPDSTSMSLVVDDYGQISSITNQAGNTTSYGYDAIGRVQDITYPATDSTPWAPKHFDYALASAPALGLPESHFVLTVTQGARVTVTHFDAMMRPILDIRRASDGTLAVSSSSDYDWRGNKIFQSYPVDGTPTRSSITSGIRTNYDALGRESSTVQSSELGNLVTATNYLSGARKQVIDPKGASTFTTYQVFDEPSYDAVTRVEGPEGVVQAINRDIFGNPKSITQSGGGVTPVAKFMWYDRYYRLCRTVEPESGSQVIAYDAANNLAWSAQGQSIQDVVDPNDRDKICGWDQVASAARTTRTYYPTNKVENIIYPGGTSSTHVTYTATGKPLTATTGTVGWTYGYNKLDLLESQVLAVDGYNWTITYRYDSQGALKSTTYPDFKEVSYLPDAHGRPTAAGSYAAGAVYYPDDDLESFTFGSGASYLANKNDRNLLSNFAYITGSTIAVGEQMAYDGNANITQIADLTDSTGQRKKNLGYDGLNRLTSANASHLWGMESYTYDTLNNIRTLTTAGVTNTYNYDGSNRLASITSGVSTVSSFGYDNRGNETSKNAMAMVFDEANRLTQVTGLDSYLYDAEGRRVKKAPASGTPTYYAYGQSGQLLWQYDPATVTGTDYIYLGNKMVASTVNATIPTVAPSLSGPATAQVNVGYTLTWTAVPGGTTYQLQEQVNGAAFNLVSNLNELSHSTAHTGPATFGYRVAACNAAGCGPWSSTVNVMVQPPPSAPSPPASISAALAGDLSSISVSWSATSDTTNYVAQVQINGGSWGAFYSGTATSSVLSAPADGTYKFQVHSCNANGCSAWTGPTATSTVAHIPTVPAAISVPATSTGPIAIGWSTTNYQTYYSLEQGFNGGAYGAIYDGAGNSYSYTATSTGTYTYRVRACNANGCSGYGPTGSSTITIPPAAAPSISVPGTSNNGAYTVSWTGVGGAATYNLQEQVNGGGFVTLQNIAATSRAISGKGNGTYGYRVQACNAGGCGPFSGTANTTVTLIPAVPANLTTTYQLPTSKGKYTISWSASSTATRYELQESTNGSTYTVIWTGPETSKLYTRAATQQMFYYQVRACNASGCSAWSARTSIYIDSI